MKQIKMVEENTIQYSFGALPGKTDIRDYSLAKSSITAESDLPLEYSSFDKIAFMPEVKNQKNVSSCVAHATSSILEYYSHEDLSTNFIYGIQSIECEQDNPGMYLRDACSIVKKYGDMLYEDCTGNDEVPVCWDIAEDAVADAEKKNRAVKYRIKSYARLKTHTEIKNALYSYGPVLASIKWYNNYKIDNDGILKGSTNGEYGLHAIMIYGWNEKGFLAQNSWGKTWGKNGRFTIPYGTEISEAYSLIDDETDGTAIKKPAKNWFIDVIYRLINYIINVFKKEK